MDKSNNSSNRIEDLLSIMARLRDPESGCPWDVEQDFATIAPFTIEEAYEVADAIERNDLSSLKDELGDLLFQVVFHARIAEERGAFAFNDVAAAIADKMLRRHPHVFGDADIADANAQENAWERMKAAERASKQAGGVLDDVPLALPALLRASKLTKRAGRVGFDWPSTDEVFAKLDEEIGELKEAAERGDAQDVAEEMGDLLFVCANLARKMGVNPEDSLRKANAKFERRFRHIESKLAETGRTPQESDLAEMDRLWDDAKAREKARKSDKA